MADSERCAVTAIREMHQEGFIAAALTRLGWKVVYRATSPERLKEFLAHNPDVLLLQSDDFAEEHLAMPAQLILVRGRSLPLADAATADPCTDFELEELLRSHKSERTEEPFYLSATTTPILAISSVGRDVGASSLSINLADLRAQQVERVLLVDGNIDHPTLARHFSIHNIRSMQQRTAVGISIFEVSDLQGLIHLNDIAGQYDAIVIDLGQLQPSYPAGRRVKDQLDSWISHSHARKIICTHTDSRSLEELELLAPQGQRWTIALALTKAVSRKERKNLESKLSEKFEVPIQSISRDSRALENMEAQSTTLANAAPKSILMGEIARLLEVALG